MPRQIKFIVENSSGTIEEETFPIADADILDTLVTWLEDDVLQLRAGDTIRIVAVQA